MLIRHEFRRGLARVQVRLLDPPLHEFLPHDDDGLDALCEQLLEQYHAEAGVRESSLGLGLTCSRECSGVWGGRRRRARC
jgi:hypothetical protein